MIYVCEVLCGDGLNDMFDVDKYMFFKEQCKVDDFILFGVVVV